MCKLLLALPLLFAPTTAMATSRHLDVEVNPIKNKTGKTTGAAITAVMSNDGHSFARLGLLPSRKDMPASGFSLKQAIMNGASTKWITKTADQDVSKGSVEFALKIDYAKSKVKPGAKYQLGSVWTNDAKASTGSHLWGVEWQNNWGDPEITMPE